MLIAGLKQMKANLKNVDCIIEIHDARISFDGVYVNLPDFKGVRILKVFGAWKEHELLINYCVIKVFFT